VPRRASLPGADLLFGSPPEPRSAPRDEVPAPPAPAQAPPPSKAKEEPAPAAAVAAEPAKTGDPGPGRPRHEEKVTFYCTASDLTRLEAARLDLRANHRLSSDRGRIVRAAIAEILDDFDARGADSLLVKRLYSE
jgi:hypothetical protein